MSWQPAGWEQPGWQPEGWQAGVGVLTGLVTESESALPAAVGVLVTPGGATFEIEVPTATFMISLPGA